MYSENPTPEQQNQYQQQFNQQNYSPMGEIAVPNASTVMTLGIVSIVTACCCYGIVGLILAVITLVMAKKAKEIYYANPSAYTAKSMSNINTGRTCAIIALVIGIVAIISYIIVISMYGISALTNPEELQEIFNKRM